MAIRFATALAACALIATAASAQQTRGSVRTFTAADVFNLEFAANPQISPDGGRVAYERVTSDVMTDRFRRSIWMVDENGRNHRAVAQGAGSYTQPVWSPDGRAIAFISTESGRAEVRVFYLDQQRTASLARLPGGADNLAWSPDGRSLAFQMHVDEPAARPAPMPERPQGAEWAPAARVFDTTLYRADGQGYSPNGYTQVFVLPADGGAPRQLTFADRNHDGRMSWSPDGRRLVFAANAEEGWELDPIESDIYALDIGSGEVSRLTTRDGQEDDPVLSPDGRRLAYVGFDDREQGYQVTELYVANADGSNPRSLTASLDRDVGAPQWSGGNLYFLFQDRGVTKLGRVSASGGRVTTLIDNIGGAALGRPYTSGAFSVNSGGRFAATIGTSQRPADVGISSGGAARQLTSLNDDTLANKIIPEARRITVRSTADGRMVDGWIVRPPNFDPSRRYPLLLEIHGGPFAAYGPVFSPDIQLYASAGYITVYANPRGSTSYGGEFGNLIHHNYPSQDYDDLMSIVDGVIAQEPIDTERLFVTGGSGGGVLTAWIVGSTNRFRAAMVQKPVINWTSFNLTSDIYPMSNRYWFAQMPWEDGAQENYWQRSPLRLVGNVTTPTAVMVGEEDYRTPQSESEQYYQALRLRGVPTRLVLIPGAPHNMTHRPTGIASTTGNVIAWFAEHGGPPMPNPNTGVAAPAATSTPVAGASGQRGN